MDQNPSPNPELPSKSQRKREAHQLQELGNRLTTYSEEQLHLLPVPVKLITAITEYNRLPNSHGARRRQLQFIGKLMRDCDYQALSDALQKLDLGQQKKPVEQKASQQWAEKIAKLGDPQINAVIDLCPALERQKLRQLYREFQAAVEDDRETVLQKLQQYLQENLKD